MFQTVHLECHQQRSFTLKMHQNRWRLGLSPRPHWGSWQRSSRPPSWIEGPTSNWRWGEGRDLGPSQCWRQIDAPANLLSLLHLLRRSVTPVGYIKHSKSSKYEANISNYNLYLSRRVFRPRLENIMIFLKISKYRKYQKYHDIFDIFWHFRYFPGNENF